MAGTSSIAGEEAAFGRKGSKKAGNFMEMSDNTSRFPAEPLTPARRRRNLHLLRSLLVIIVLVLLVPYVLTPF
jgi:hypothetical protein